MFDMQKMKYDVFISHASEDKGLIVRPLVMLLEELSVRVWYDEFSLKLGDSLSASIDKGLLESKFGIVVLSKSFLKKNWTDYEYRSLLSRQMNGQRIIIPLWYDISKEEVLSFSPYLADVFAGNVTPDNLPKTVLSVLKVVRPDILRSIKIQSYLRNLINKGERKAVNINEITRQTQKQSHLTPQQYIRAKSIFYGIGKHVNLPLNEFIDEYELDVVPEREIQTWEIMNVCYLEMLERYPESSDHDKHEYYAALIAISISAQNLQRVDLPVSKINELIELWNENCYEF